MMLSTKSLEKSFAHQPLIGGWPSNLEPISLGGLLIMRMELEMISSFFSSSMKTVLFSKEELHAYFALIQQIFDETFSIREQGALAPNWPLEAHQNDPSFTYQNFKKICWLSKKLHTRPLLSFTDADTKETLRFLQQFTGKKFTVHLKNGRSEESAATQSAWKSFFQLHADKNRVQFILLGNDEIDRDFRTIPGVIIAQSLGLTLKRQLALVAQSDGFLGMASGICQTAIFSNVPYVIFKHPLHHVDQMQQELGNSTKFSFGILKQYIWRKIDALSSLEEAYRILQE